MLFEMPKYFHPDFEEERFVNAPDVAIETVKTDGVAPRNYHSTSMYPEYFKIDGQWKLAEESRMDSCIVLCDNGTLAVVIQLSFTVVSNRISGEGCCSISVFINIVFKAFIRRIHLAESL